MELIWGLSGLLIGGFFATFGMAMLSGRAYEKGRKDGEGYGYVKGWHVGYEDAYIDQSTADEVVFTSKTENEGD